MQDLETRQRLRAAYFSAATAFETATREMCERGYDSSGASSGRRAGSSTGLGLGAGAGTEAEAEAEAYTESEFASLRAQRDVLATRLRVRWLELEPYVRAKSIYDRWGVYQLGEGTIKWNYRTMEGNVETQVLGEAQSLSALKRALAEIEEAAAAAAAAAGGGATAAQPGTSSRERTSRRATGQGTEREQRRGRSTSRSANRLVQDPVPLGTGVTTPPTQDAPPSPAVELAHEDGAGPEAEAAAVRKEPNGDALASALQASTLGA